MSTRRGARRGRICTCGRAARAHPVLTRVDLSFLCLTKRSYAVDLTHRRQARRICVCSRAPESRLLTEVHCNRVGARASGVHGGDNAMRRMGPAVQARDTGRHPDGARLGWRVSPGPAIIPPGPQRRATVPHSSRGPGHSPLKAEIIGSNPICGTRSPIPNAPGSRPGGVLFVPCSNTPGDGGRHTAAGIFPWTAPRGRLLYRWESMFPASNVAR